MKLDINNKLFLGNAELVFLQKSLQDEGFKKHLLLNTGSYGIIRESLDFNFDAFAVKEDTSRGLKITRSSYGIDTAGNLLTQEPVSNLTIPTQDVWYWMKISHQYSVLEKGTVSISSNGEITGVGTEFLSRLRGQPNFTSKIRFIDSASNTGEYSIQSISSNTFGVLAGNSFVNESNLTYQIIGTFPPSHSPEDEDKYPFNYDSCSITFVEEQTLNTPPAKSEGVEFFIARVKKTSSSVVIQDKRTEFYYTKSNLLLKKTLTSNNTVVGVEDVKWNPTPSTQEHNLVTIGWGFRTSNFTISSSLRKVTISSGKGGRFKSTSKFTTGDFDGWRIYVTSGKYYEIVSSTSDSSQINLILKDLDVDEFVEEEELFITPNVDSIEFMFTPVTTEYKQFEHIVSSPINPSYRAFHLPVPNSSTFSYLIKYRYLNHGMYSSWTLMDDDGTNGYFTEDSFDENGDLKLEQDRTKKTYTSSQIELVPSTTHYKTLISSLITGDLFGVEKVTLLNSTFFKTLIVGSTKQVQDFSGSISFTTNHIWNFSKTNTKEGNRFRILFRTDVTSNDYSFYLTQDWDGVGSIPDAKILKKFTELDFILCKNSRLVIDVYFDGTDWQVTGFQESVSGFTSNYYTSLNYSNNITYIGSELTTNSNS